jgi:hypothetical protein
MEAAKFFKHEDGKSFYRAGSERYITVYIGEDYQNISSSPFSGNLGLFDGETEITEAEFMAALNVAAPAYFERVERERNIINQLLK